MSNGQRNKHNTDIRGARILRRFAMAASALLSATGGFNAVDTFVNRAPTEVVLQGVVACLGGMALGLWFWRKGWRAQAGLDLR
jgi:hypothetical protein